MKKQLIILLLVLPQLAGAQTAQEIIKKLDQNENFSTERVTAVMTIQKGSRKLVKEFISVTRKAGEKSFMTFLNAEDRGVKYLKIKNNLWIYFPDADSVMKISGHMLRQGMMGSDISYDDMLNSGGLEKKYSARLLADKMLASINCYVLELKAKTADASYARQIIYIDKQKMVPVQIEMYAQGGRMVKLMTMSGYRSIGGYQVAHEMTIQDKRKTDSKTTVTIKNIQFNISVPESTFTRAHLKR